MRINPTEQKTTIETGPTPIDSKKTGAPKSTAPPIDVPGTELATVPKIFAITPSTFFKPEGHSEILEALEIEVRAIAATLDISRPEDREAIRSLAFRVAKTKTGLDEARKDLVEDWKKQSKAVDAEGKRVWERIEKLQHEVRKPLTDWESADATRVAFLEGAVSVIEAVPGQVYRTITEVDNTAADLETRVGMNWQEFTTRADKAISLARMHLKTRREDIEQDLKDKIELARLRAEQAERDRLAERQRIADEAAAAERTRQQEIQAEQAKAAEAERARIENERHEAEAKAKQLEAQRVAEAEQAERDRIAAAEREKAAAAKAEAERLEAEERHNKELLEAADRAENERKAALERERVAAERREREKAEEAERHAAELEEREAAAEQRRVAAIKAERERLEAERAAERQKELDAAAERQRVADEENRERLKRQANVDHIASVKQTAADALIRIVGSNADIDPDELGWEIVDAIAAGRIPNVTITY